MADIDKGLPNTRTQLNVPGPEQEVDITEQQQQQPQQPQQPPPKNATLQNECSPLRVPTPVPARKCNATKFDYFFMSFSGFLFIF